MSQEVLDSIVEELGLNPDDFQRRKDYLGLDEGDAARLRALQSEADRLKNVFADRFDKAFGRSEEFDDVLAKATHIQEQMRTDHGNQLSAIVSSGFDLDYARERLRIGLAHQRVGLKPEWYVGSLASLLEELLPAALRACEGDAERFSATALSLFKVCLLDIELVISAYFHADQKHLRFLAKAFESDLEGVLITDLSGTIIHASYLTQEISGYAPEQLVGQNIRLLLSERNEEHLYKRWAREAVDDIWRGDVWHRHAGGHDYLARMSFAPVKNEAGAVTHYVSEYSDITDAWEAEQALKARTEELARSNRELEQFAYVASHDLQEPLRMVASYTQLLARRYKGKLDQDADEFIGYAVDGATRMQVLINDLLKLSRVGTRGKSFASTDCGRVLDSALANLSVAVQESGAAVTWDAMPVVMGDDTQLIQLFQNLIGNALKFRAATESAQIHVGARRVDGAWEFSVRDNGIGIAPEYFERIFVIFQRLHSKAEYPGTGIGLALCKKIVERHGGRIWVESRSNEGTTFFFTIPDKESGIHGH
ncbi:hypothetical protein B9N43_02340 [Denitratisoma sp. DHT3]|uniref:sensor histidine kinase n=1 Tax=Denitratisoma sp. DHT3 TaxID=1981880 RepID=UPI0011989579|nr:ATP-binding protein [Denitratisoma sp. DHT3]QDX80200.1 hypothetical protein B9N43_02340 [Denitratisoma sp. DHT3]